LTNLPLLLRFGIALRLAVLRLLVAFFFFAAMSITSGMGADA
jgi:hypothetical protein